MGTLIGQAFVSQTLEVAFLALAAGSLLYVVIQLMHVNRQLGHAVLVAWMLLAGLFLGFGTEFVIEAARRLARPSAAVASAGCRATPRSTRS